MTDDRKTTRRALLAGAAAVPAIAIAPPIALAGESDPIFAAIEECTRAESDFEAFLDERAPKEEAAYALRGQDQQEAIAALDAAYDEFEHQRGGGRASSRPSLGSIAAAITLGAAERNTQQARSA
jgi:hypothetical protein